MLTVGNYHYIRENFDSDYPSIFGVKPAEFKKQLELLKNEGDFISPNQFLSDIDGILKSNENLILITFDDGLKEQFELALPILDEKQIPAIFFANSLNAEEKKVTTVHKIHLLRSVLSPEILLKKIAEVHDVVLSETVIQRAKEIYRFDEPQSATLKYVLNFKIPFDLQEQIVDRIFVGFFEEETIWKQLYMDENQLKYLASHGYLGSHTHSHLPLGLLDEEMIYFELEHAKAYFEKLTNCPIDMISYPYGTDETTTDQVLEVVNKVGYKVGFTTKRGENNNAQNHFKLNRFDCNDLVGGKNHSSWKQ